MVSKAEREQIASWIAEVESTTEGEIVAVIANRSDSYPGARWRLAITFALLCAFAVAAAFPEWPGVYLLWLQLPAIALGYALGKWTPLLRFFLLESRMQEEVHQRAVEAFFRNQLHSTRERAGVLILISLLEHRVEILADVGIHQKAGQEVWIQVIERLLERIRRGELTPGLGDAIREVGLKLKSHFPASGKPKNELPNHLILIED